MKTNKEKKYTKAKNILSEYSTTKKNSGKKLNPLQRKKLKKIVAKQDVLELCYEHKSLSEIADKLDISLLVAATHIERILRKHQDIPVTQFLLSERVNEIEEVFLLLQTASVKRVLEYMKWKVSEEEVRVVRGWLRGKMEEGEGD